MVDFFKAVIMTNWFEVYYSEFLAFAKAQIYKNDRGNIFIAEDVLNDAYIKFFESGLEFSEDLIKGYILTAIHKHNDQLSRRSLFGDAFKKTDRQIKGDFTCNKCKGTKSVGEFRYIKYEGFSYLEKTCAKCKDKMRTEWARANKERWNAYVRERYWESKNFVKKAPKPIHDLWKKANHKYIAKQKEQLTDVYVRSLLPKDKRTPKFIEAKRQEIIAKRKAHDEQRNGEMNIAAPLTQV